MATVKDLIVQLGELKQSEKVYGELKLFLEGFVQVDETETSRPMTMDDGTVIPTEVIYSVLADLDEYGLGPIVEKINSIEGTEVAGAKKQGKRKENKQPAKRKSRG